MEIAIKLILGSTMKDEEKTYLISKITSINKIKTVEEIEDEFCDKLNILCIERKINFWTERVFLTDENALGVESLQKKRILEKTPAVLSELIKNNIEIIDKSTRYCFAAFKMRDFGPSIEFRFVENLKRGEYIHVHPVNGKDVVIYLEDKFATSLMFTLYKNGQWENELLTAAKQLVSNIEEGIKLRDEFNLANNIK